MSKKDESEKKKQPIDNKKEKDADRNDELEMNDLDEASGGGIGSGQNGFTKPKDSHYREP